MARDVTSNTYCDLAAQPALFSATYTTNQFFSELLTLLIDHIRLPAVSDVPRLEAASWRNFHRLGLEPWCLGLGLGLE